MAGRTDNDKGNATAKIGLFDLLIMYLGGYYARIAGLKEESKHPAFGDLHMAEDGDSPSLNPKSHSSNKPRRQNLKICDGPFSGKVYSKKRR